MSNGMQYGGFWRRAIAAFVDAFVIGFIALPIFFAAFAGIIFYVISIGGGAWTASTTIGTNEVIAGFVGNLVFLLVYIGYFAGMESSLRQATYGKMMLGVKVVDEDGFRISFWHAVGRYFAKYLSIFTLFIGFLMAAFTEKKQALHDMVAKTLVIKEGGYSLWPAIKAVLISILLLVLLIAGCVYYGYIKYGSMLGEKSFQEFFTELISTATLSGYITTSDSLITEIREDGLIYELNKKLPFTGKYTSEYPNGQKEQELTVVEGRLDGPYTIWHESGQKKEIGTYEKGLVHGSGTYWFEDGKREERFFKNGEFDGPYTFYYPNGQKQQEGTRKSNQFHGLITLWDEEGNFLETHEYENGTLIATSTTPPDTLSEESNDNLTTDLQDHEAPASTEETFDLENNNDAATPNVQLKESFHENGVKKMEAHYVDGKLNGSSTLWNEYGQKIIIVNYKEDKRHGLLTRWHNNGQKKIEINYTDDKRDGEMTFWNENGDIKKTLTYSNGERVEKESPQMDDEETSSNSNDETKDDSAADTAQKINSDIEFPEPPEISFNYGSTVTTGPSVLGYLGVKKNKADLRMFTSPIPNLKQAKILIDVETVLDIDNINYYDPEKNSTPPCCGLKKKQSREARLLIPDKDEPTPHLYSSWGIYLNKNLTKDKLLSVSGNVVILFPETTEIVTFLNDEIPAEGLENPLIFTEKQKTIDKTAAGNLVSLIGFEKEQSYVRPDDDYKVTILFDTNLKEDVAMFAYDTNGAVIQRNNFPAMFSRGMQRKNACIIWSPDGTSKKDFCTREGEVLSAKYPEKPTKIEVHISKMATQKFPFTLTK